MGNISSSGKIPNKLNINLASAKTLTATTTSDTLELNVKDFSIQVVITGNPTGTVYIEGSNDLGNNPTGVVSQINGISNWTAFDQAATITSADTIMFNVVNCNYRWIRIKATIATGAGTMTANFSAIVYDCST